MTVRGTTDDERLAQIAEAKRLEEEAARAGERYGPELLARPAGTWRRMMRGHARYRSYGVLKYLLEAARERFETQPTVAHELTAVVLDFLEESEAPSHVHAIALRGLAWKERANTCEVVGDLRGALAAAERSVAIYDESPALMFDQTRAKLVVCKVLREMGETERAMRLARECAAVFADFGERPFVNMARMFEAGVLFASKRYREAFAIFTNVMAEAERAGDRLTVARCLVCAAQSAREFGELETARDFYGRAMAHFDALDLATETNNVRWGLAVTLALAGKTAAAISELYKVRAVFLSFGMNSRAASAALDIVRIRFDDGDDVVDLCTELVPVFTSAGLTQSAIEALAYLREQARAGRLTAKKITRVRTYFDELANQPSLLFVQPPEREID